MLPNVLTKIKSQSVSVDTTSKGWPTIATQQNELTVTKWPSL